MNICALSGRLGADPVTNVTKSDQVTNFSIAFNPTKSKTCWIKVVCYKKLSEIADKYLGKGDKISVVGKIEENKWEEKDGTERSTWQIVASSIDFVSVKGLQGKDEVPFE